jgi:nucleoid DNA-binding protein
MNKTQLIDVVAQASGLKKKEAEAAINATLSAISAALAEGDDVRLIGFGNFEVKETKEREGRNPVTGEKITIAASKRPVFSASKALKAQVNG